MRVVGDENNSQSFRINGDQAPIEDASSIEREREGRSLVQVILALLKVEVERDGFVGISG